MKYFARLFYAPLLLFGLLAMAVSMFVWFLRRGKRFPTGGFTVGAVLVFLYMGKMQTEGILGLGVPRTFTVHGWAKTSPEDRHFMVDSLRKTVPLVGIGGDDLRALLGEPDYLDTPELMEYVIDRPFDESTLDFQLEDGIVTAVDVTPEH